MRLQITRFISPTLDILEHSTVIAIGIQYIAEHWTNLVCVTVVIVYIVYHRVARSQSAAKAK